MPMAIPIIGYENLPVVNLNKEFKLKAGQQVELPDENFKISFISVVEDSRCPIGIDLSAEGNAEILFIFYHNGYEMEAVLNTNLQPQSILFRDFQITLKRLNPYPIHQKIIFHGCYTANLVIKRIRAKTYS
jgi:hypothetical protein